MLGYLVFEVDERGWNKPLKVFEDKGKAIEYAHLRQQESNDNGWGLDLRYFTIEIIN